MSYALQTSFEKVLGKYMTEDDALTLAICLGVGLVVALIACVAVLVYKKNQRDELYNDATSKVRTIENATVLEKTVEQDPRLGITVRRVLIEERSGGRVSFVLKDEALYQRIVEKDIGTVYYKGNVMCAFER